MLFDPRREYKLTPPDPLALAARALFDAADYLDKYGWVQGTFAVGARRCVMSALREVADPVTANNAVYHLGKAIGGDGQVVNWNDNPMQTKAEITCTMRRTGCQLTHKLSGEHHALATG